HHRLEGCSLPTPASGVPAPRGGHMTPLHNGQYWAGEQQLQLVTDELRAPPCQACGAADALVFSHGRILCRSCAGRIITEPGRTTTEFLAVRRNVEWERFIVEYDQRLHPARGIVRGICVGAAVWALLIFTAMKLHGQVDARLVIRGRDAS